VGILFSSQKPFPIPGKRAMYIYVYIREDGGSGGGEEERIQMTSPQFPFFPFLLLPPSTSSYRL